MNNTQFLDFQIESQKLKDNIKNTPIVLSLGFRYIKSWENRCEYWIKKKFIKIYAGSNSDLAIRGGIGNPVIFTLEPPKYEEYKDFQVDRDIWMNYNEIEIIEEIIEHKNNYSNVTNSNKNKKFISQGVVSYKFYKVVSYKFYKKN